MSSYHFVEHIDDRLRADLMELYRHEWWTNQRREEDVARMLLHTDLVVGVVLEPPHLDPDGPRAVLELLESVDPLGVGARDDAAIALRGNNRDAGHRRTGKRHLPRVVSSQQWLGADREHEGEDADASQHGTD